MSKEVAMRRRCAGVLAVFAAACSRGVQPDPALHMVAIPPCTFVMGSNDGEADEKPAHPVTLTRPFWIGKYEVTQAQYQAVTAKNPSLFQGAEAPDAPQRPVETVSWDDAMAYCKSLTANEQAAGRVPEGYQYRLPTEAEWEYCCRAGTTTPWHTGANLEPGQANFGGARECDACPDGQTAAVGNYPANAWCLHDMHGNVWEWCLDSYGPYAPASVAPFVTGGANRVVRGGSWYSLLSAAHCRSAFRYSITPDSADILVGFRVVLAPVLVP
ncbi:MAG: formylglycine-generating enzyme family protein [Planctomycetota bacterium]|jgi:formylglycine-generating enzyme required for sulfatase activity